MTATWDPRSLFDVYPDKCGFTCVGTTKQGPRCRQSRISKVSLKEASNILDEMQMMDIRDRDFMNQISPKLDRLAEMTLCPRWHRDHKYGNCQRPQVHYKWFNIVSNWRNYLLARTATEGSLESLRQPLNPPAISFSQSSLSSRTLLTSILGAPAPAPDQPNSYFPVSPPATPSSSSTSLPTQASYTSQNTYNNNTNGQGPSLESAQLVDSYPSPLSSTTSTLSSFDDSGYSSAHSNTDSSTASGIGLLFTQPAMIFPSPPPSAWSMDLPTPTTTTSETSSLSHSSVPQSITPGSSSSHSSRNSRRSSRPQAPSATSSFANALATSLATALANVPSSPSVRSSSSARSSDRSSSSRSSRSQAPVSSQSLANVIATAIAPTIATVVAEHLTSVLTDELSRPESLAALTPLLESAPGATSPGGQTTTHSQRSSRSSRSQTPRSPQSPASPAAARVQPPLPSQPALATRTVVRRPLTDPCYVCTLPIDDLDDAVWCRASCGQNLHIECFEMWAETQADHRRNIECAFCRALWV